MHALATAGAPTQPGHVGFRPALVDEDESLRIEAPLESAPLLAGLENVRAVLLAGTERLFLYVKPMAASA